MALGFQGSVPQKVPNPLGKHGSEFSHQKGIYPPTFIPSLVEGCCQGHQRTLGLSFIQTEHIPGTCESSGIES